MHIVEYLEINKIVAPPNIKSIKTEENVREPKFIADLRIIMKETSRDRELIATMIALEKGDETDDNTDNYQQDWVSSFWTTK